MKKRDKTYDIVSPLKKCIHGQPAACMQNCPFDFDIRKFTEKIKDGIFSGAYNIYREAVVFPGIVSYLCPAVCKVACETKLDGNPIQINELEKGVFELYKTKEPINYNAPKQNCNIAVIGSHLSGCTAALKLSQNGYSLNVFSSEAYALADMSEYIPLEELTNEVNNQFKFASCKFNFETDFDNVAWEGFDIILVTDKNISLKEENNVFSCTDETHSVYDIQIGKLIAKQADWFFKTQKPFDKSEIDELIKKYAEINMSDKGEGSFLSEKTVLNKAELRNEANRCTGCDCNECLTKCAMLRDSNMTIGDISRCIGLSLNLFEHTEVREGTRQIGACNDCGLCKSLCPEGVDVGSALLAARSELFAQGNLPPAHHEYWLRDMAFADSEEISLFYMPGETSEYVFFPGCQTGGSDTRYVSLTYEKLLQTYPDTALLLYCCGAPLLWAGDLDGLKKEHEKIREYWVKTGKAEFVTVCPSCYRMFKQYLPEITVKMLYEVMSTDTLAKSTLPEAAVFDPCSSRNYPELQASVRAIAQKSGISLTQLPFSEDKAQCCGWGGHAYNVNKTLVKKQTKQQANESELPYITYCTNCRDIFALNGKQNTHILDIILGINQTQRACPTIDERRTNRKKLKLELCRKYDIKTVLPENEEQIKLNINDDLQKKLNEDLILSDDIIAVINNANATLAYIINEENAHRVAHLKRGIITYWVEYALSEDGSYDIFSVYSHRMRIKDDLSLSERL